MLTHGARFIEPRFRVNMLRRVRIIKNRHIFIRSVLELICTNPAARIRDTALNAAISAASSRIRQKYVDNREGVTWTNIWRL